MPQRKKSKCGRPAIKPESRRQGTGVTFAPETLDLLDKTANMRGLSRSRAVEEAVTDWLQNVVLEQPQLSLKNPSNGDRRDYIQSHH